MKFTPDLRRARTERVAQLSIGSWRFALERMPHKHRDLVRKYDAAAWLWDPVLRMQGYFRSYMNLFNKLASHGWVEGLRNGSTVLDAGIGSAAFSMALVKTRPIPLEIHGIDIAPRMLARAQAKFKRLRNCGVILRLRYGNAENLPYTNNHFEMVMSAHMLEHSHDPQAAIIELTRVLRSGSPLLIVAIQPNPLSGLHRLRWRYNPLEPASIKNWMHHAGLRDIRGYTLKGGLMSGFMSSACIGSKK